MSFIGHLFIHIYRYVKAGILIPAFYTCGQHRRFSLSQLKTQFKTQFNIDNDSNIHKAHLTVCYSRVSSHDQKHDLIAQEKKLLHYAKVNNYKKKGLKQLIDLIFSGQVKTMIINHKDRLLRFGSELIFYLCQLFKVNVIVIE